MGTGNAEGSELYVGLNVIGVHRGLCYGFTGNRFCYGFSDKVDGLAVQYGDVVEVMQGMIESVQIPEKVPIFAHLAQLCVLGLPLSLLWWCANLRYCTIITQQGRMCDRSSTPMLRRHDATGGHHYFRVDGVLFAAGKHAGQRVGGTGSVPQARRCAVPQPCSHVPGRGSLFICSFAAGRFPGVLRLSPLCSELLAVESVRLPLGGHDGVCHRASLRLWHRTFFTCDSLTLLVCLFTSIAFAALLVWVFLGTKLR